VLELSPDKLDRYRAIIVDIDASAERKDDVIRTLAGIMQNFIDAAFGVDPVQLVIQSKLSQTFQNASIHGSISDGHDTARIDLAADEKREGANTYNDETKGCAPWSPHI
jgi:hypothetical protein